MHFQYDAAIIGGDLRQIYLAYILEKNGYKIITFGLNYIIPNFNLNFTSSYEQAMSSSNTIISPIPFSRDKIYITGLENNTSNDNNKLSVEAFLKNLQHDHYLIGGNIYNEVIDICSNENIPYFDLMKNEDIALLNAIATAEGTIAEAIYKSSINLHNSNALVLGYGKCGKVLASKLQAIGVNVTVAARKKNALVEAYTNCIEGIKLYKIKSEIKNFNFIFNTVPSLILDEKLLLSISPETTIIDIASQPGGVDYETAKNLNLNAHLCLGIPGKISPKSSAEILADVILPILKERKD
ncbi:dipicolinate synthase subunit A [Sedimentibacter acidaminivorans]|uniref:Dipicolinate synthase subunit A n=1 Tax=Sedimentibacter acidaminivorans TaxID=913099 RepID=A0ABS4GH71_9FIRM|nr:dipicolinate synthase subunit DpsA [Sedimentibacter acidaminivorans]MBP1927040.1 dipicolinate synthase subunit A [Sedimentibacter acidaminivorans]